MNAAVPFGMESADFRDLMATAAIAFAAALVLVVLLIVVRDVLVARYTALGRQEKPERPREGTHLPPVLGSPLPRLYEHEIPVSPREHPQLRKRPRPPKADPTVWPKPRMVHPSDIHSSQIPTSHQQPDGTWHHVVGDSADRLRTPSPASDLPAPPKGSGGIAPPRNTTEHRISARADRDADRTRLDLTPTEEN